MQHNEINVILGDGEKAVREPKKNYDWGVDDPPYFDGPNNRKYYGKSHSKIVKRKEYDILENWNILDESYYNSFIKMTTDQIIWGINNYEFAGRVKGRIVWDKCNYTSTYSDCEIASISSIDSIRLFAFLWNGMMQGKSITEGRTQQGNKKLNEKRIHATQKPVALYKWILDKFIRPDQSIIDPHGGSMSSVIACIDMGYSIDCYEISESVYRKAKKRIIEHVSQLDLFNRPKINFINGR